MNINKQHNDHCYITEYATKTRFFKISASISGCSGGIYEHINTTQIHWWGYSHIRTFGHVIGSCLFTCKTGVQRRK